MAEQDRRLELIHAAREPGFSASLLTTYNAYLPFYEEVVLRRLVAAGCHHNIVLMDAGQCAAALSGTALRPRRAGRDYVLLPVATRGAFHPKIFMRLGKRAGSLFVGSHNLTLAGFGLNAELTNRFECRGKPKRSDVAPFAGAADLLREYTSDAPSPVREAVDAALEAAPWLAGPRPVEDEVRVLGTHPRSDSLWAQLRALIPEDVSRALVVAPFFDGGLHFVRVVRDAIGAAELTVAVDPSTVELPSHIAPGLERARFVDIRGLLPSDRRRDEAPAYLHAKALWFESADGDDLLVSGSANASHAAYLGDQAINAEAIVVRRGALRDVAEELGLASFFDAPEVTTAGWSEIAGREPTESGVDDDAARRVALAVATDDGFSVDVELSEGASYQAFDDAGQVIGAAIVEEVGPTSRLRAGDTVVAEAQLLEASSPACPIRHLLVHRPEAIAEHYTSDARRRLRQALGSLEEDPHQLELLLRLSERAIFDSDEVTRDPGRLRQARKPAGASEPPEAVESLAVESRGARRTRPRAGLASGDITVLLDALIRRLGSDLPGAAPASRKSEEELVGSDDPDDLPPPVLSDPAQQRALADACQKKVRRLLRRMQGQLEAAEAPETAARAVVQLAAVLGVVRALAMIERRDEWRKVGAALLPEEPLWNFFGEATARVAAGSECLLSRALEWVGEAYEEHSVVVGLLVWLAWVSDVDVAVARGRGGFVGVEDELWPWVQSLVHLAPHLIDDPRARGLAVDSVRQTPRWRQTPDRWLGDQLELLDFAAMLNRMPDGLEDVASPQPGDLVVLPAKFEPRVRVVQRASRRVVSGREMSFVTVVDDDAPGGERCFATTKSRVVRFRPLGEQRDAG